MVKRCTLRVAKIKINPSLVYFASGSGGSSILAHQMQDHSHGHQARECFDLHRDGSHPKDCS